MQAVNFHLCIDTHFGSYTWIVLPWYSSCSLRPVLAICQLPMGRLQWRWWQSHNKCAGRVPWKRILWNLCRVQWWLIMIMIKAGEGWLTGWWLPGRLSSSLHSVWDAVTWLHDRKSDMPPSRNNRHPRADLIQSSASSLPFLGKVPRGEDERSGWGICCRYTTFPVSLNHG